MKSNAKMLIQRLQPESIILYTSPIYEWWTKRTLAFWSLLASFLYHLDNWASEIVITSHPQYFQRHKEPLI